MKIVSKFKDYYDYVAYSYDRGDPSIVYNRIPITKLSINDSKIDYISIRDDSDLKYVVISTKSRVCYRFEDRSYLDRRQFDCSYIYVLGRLYFLVTDIGHYHDKVSNNYNLLISNPNYSRLIKNYHPEFDGNSIPAPPEFIEFSNKLRQPVLKIESSVYGSSIDLRIPNLSEIKFHKIIPPERMYQELAIELGRYNDKPTIELSNNSKIEKAGFDIHSSFRGINK